MERIKGILNGRTGELLTAAAKDVVRGVAPNLGRALDSPLAQAATKEIARQVLGNPDAPVPEVSARLEAMTTEDVKALSHAQAKVMEAAHAANVDLARIGAQDRQSARQSHAESWTPVILAVLAFAALVGFGAALLVYEPAGAARDMLMAIMGALIVMAKQGYDFFLGSSAGSKQKTGLLAGKPDA